MATAAAVVSAVVGVVGAGVSVAQQLEARSDQKKADREQRKAERLQQRQASIRNARERRQAIAKQRQIRASVIASGQASGAGDSSAIQGAVGSLDTQLASNVAFQERLNTLDQQRIGALNQRNTFISSANQALGTAATAQAIGGLPEQLGFGTTGQNIGRIVDGSVFSQQGSAI